MRRSNNTMDTLCQQGRWVGAPRARMEWTMYDPDELYAIEQVAHEEPEVVEAIEEWARMSIRGRSDRVDAWLLDRLEAIVHRAVERYQRDARDRALHGDEDAADEHERGFVA